MIYSVTNLLGLEVYAATKAVGTVQDLYFDELSWQVHGLVLSMDGRVDHEAICLAPNSLTSIIPSLSGLSTDLTEAELEKGHSAAHLIQQAEQQDVHLRRFSDLVSRHAQALDGPIGRLEDMLFDTKAWHVRYLILALEPWPDDRAVQIATSEVNLTSWLDGELVFNLSCEAIKSAPHYHRPKQKPKDHWRSHPSVPSPGQGDGDYGHSRELQEEGPDGQAGFPETFEPFDTVETAANPTPKGREHLRQPARPTPRHLQRTPPTGPEVIPLESEKSERPAH